MKKILISVIAALSLASPALAAHAATATLTGNDVSYPQCGKTLPSTAFGIVGVNGGKATTFNSCFSTQLAWAQTAKGGTGQPKTALYLNTANPGDVLAQYNVTDWPSSSVAADPYGVCQGTWTDDAACSWEYGYERAQADLNQVAAYTTANAYNYWLDAETGNSWTSDSVKNRADLEGMTYALQQAGVAAVGLYSTASQWNSIAGTAPSTSSLYTLAEWRPGARSLKVAQSDCTATPFTGGGSVSLTQYISQNLDYDYSCI